MQKQISLTQSHEYLEGSASTHAEQASPMPLVYCCRSQDLRRKSGCNETPSFERRAEPPLRKRKLLLCSVFKTGETFTYD